MKIICLILVLIGIAACSDYSFRASLSDSTYINHNYGNETAISIMYYRHGNSTEYTKLLYDNDLGLYYGISTLLPGNITMKATAIIGSTCTNSTYYIFDKLNNIIVSSVTAHKSIRPRNMTIHTSYLTDDPAVFTVMASVPAGCLMFAERMHFSVEID